MKHFAQYSIIGFFLVGLAFFGGAFDESEELTNPYIPLIVEISTDWDSASDEGRKYICSEVNKAFLAAREWEKEHRQDFNTPLNELRSTIYPLAVTECSGQGFT